MIKKYVIEKGTQIPLCAIVDDMYIDYLKNKTLNNANIEKFINNGLEKNTLEIEEMTFKVYKIMEKSHKKLIGYNYVINNCTNFLDVAKQPMTYKDRQFTIDKIMKNEYIQEVLWDG